MAPVVPRHHPPPRRRQQRGEDVEGPGEVEPAVGEQERGGVGSPHSCTAIRSPCESTVRCGRGPGRAKGPPRPAREPTDDLAPSPPRVTAVSGPAALPGVVLAVFTHRGEPTMLTRSPPSRPPAPPSCCSPWWPSCVRRHRRRRRRAALLRRLRGPRRRVDPGQEAPRRGSSTPAPEHRPARRRARRRRRRPTASPRARPSPTSCGPRPSRARPRPRSSPTGTPGRQPLAQRGEAPRR